MEQLMGLMAVGFAEELFIKNLYRRILVRFPDGHRAILAVCRLGARSLRIYKVARACIDVRLAAACYAAARAAHYLDKVVILFAALDRFKKLANFFALKDSKATKETEEEERRNRNQRYEDDGYDDGESLF